MSLFQPRTFPEIMGGMIARIIATTPINDINYGSVITTMLEAAAQEDDEQYFQMLEIIRGYSLDTTSGSDLDARAFEYGLIRLTAQKASTNVTLGDSAITKVSTKVYAGLSGAAAGTLAINGEDDAGFDTSGGSLIVGRGTNNVETVTYTSITDNGNYFTFNLSSAFTNDHGTDETIIFAQGGDRTISAGTVVYVPASDINPKISFITDALATILDGEEVVEEIGITAVSAGTASNVPIGSIRNYDSPPFSTATVTNPERITNGSDAESDQELRDRIKDTIQSLSRGTGRSIITGVIGLISSNKRVVSASLIEPTIPADVVRLYIDDGTSFVPTYASVGLETLVADATGGEKYIFISNVPVLKAFVETDNAEPYNLSGNETLFISVGGEVETVTFAASDFATLGSATAQEVATKINSVASLYEARISSGGTKVKVFARANFDERIQVTGGTSNTALDFPTDIKYTTKLFLKRDNVSTLLSKDGITASIECGNAETYNFVDGALFLILVNGNIYNPITITFHNGNFVNPAAATAEEVAIVINRQIVGATATVTSNGTKVTITSDRLRSSTSKIQILPGYDTTPLGWSTVEVVGANKDYSLNRFIGQIELVTPLRANDQLTLGSDDTRASLYSGTGPYNILNTQTLTLKLSAGGDPDIPFTVTFLNADFAIPGAGTATEVATKINSSVDGITASVIGGKIQLRTNEWENSTLEVTGGSANAVIGFPVAKTTSLDPHYASVESLTPFSFNPNDYILVIVDGNQGNNLTVPCYRAGTTTAAGSSTTIVDSSLNAIFPNNSDLSNDFEVVIVGPVSPPHALLNVRKTISSYNHTTNTITTANWGGTPGSGTQYQILPKNASGVVELWKNTLITLLSVTANVDLTEGGTKVQLSSKTPGENGSIQVAGGPGNSNLSFPITIFYGVDAYKYYTGLAQVTQWTVDGREDDQDNYPGIRAAGVQVEVLEPITKPIKSSLVVSTIEGVSLGSLTNDIKSAVSAYINALPVGGDVLISNIIVAVKAVAGVLDVHVTTPAANVAVADAELARIKESDISIG